MTYEILRVNNEKSLTNKYCEAFYVYCVLFILYSILPILGGVPLHKVIDWQ